MCFLGVFSQVSQSFIKAVNSNLFERLKLSLFLVGDGLKHGDSSVVEVFLKIESLVDQEIEHRSLLDEPVLIMNSLVIQLLLDWLSEFLLHDLNLILPLES